MYKFFFIQNKTFIPKGSNWTFGQLRLKDWRLAYLFFIKKRTLQIPRTSFTIITNSLMPLEYNFLKAAKVVGLSVVGFSHALEAHGIRSLFDNKPLLTSSFPGNNQEVPLPYRKANCSLKKAYISNSSYLPISKDF